MAYRRGKASSEFQVLLVLLASLALGCTCTWAGTLTDLCRTTPSCFLVLDGSESSTMTLGPQNSVLEWRPAFKRGSSAFDLRQADAQRAPRWVPGTATSSGFVQFNGTQIFPLSSNKVELPGSYGDFVTPGWPGMSLIILARRVATPRYANIFDPYGMNFSDFSTVCNIMLWTRPFPDSGYEANVYVWLDWSSRR